MREKPSAYTLLSWVQRIYEIPEYFDELDTIDLKELSAYLVRRRSEIYADINSLLIHNPDYNYPQEWQSNKPGYWLNSGYQYGMPNTFIIELIKRIEAKLNGASKAQEPQEPITQEKREKIDAKYYAVLQWIRIKEGMDPPFELTKDDKWPKAEIMRFAENRYPEISPQAFYRAFTSDDITNTIKFPNDWGRGYKDKIIEASGNDHKIILALKNWPR